MNIDMQSYLDALQSTQFSKELVNQGLEMAQQKKEATMPLSELSLGEGVKILGEQAYSYVKQQGTQMIKDALRTKMKDAGVDEDTINSTLEGDLNLDTLTSKVGSLISKAKSTAQDLVSQAQTRAEGIVSDLQSQAQDLVGQVQSQAEGLVGQVQSQAEGLVGQAQDLVGQVQSQAEGLVEQIPTQDEVLALASQRTNITPTQADLPEGAGTIQELSEGGIQNITDSLDNITSVVRSNIADAQGIADDLLSQSMQQYNLLRSAQPSLMEAETGTSNILSRINNFFQRPQIEPQDIEMVDLAPEISSTIAPEISSTIAPTISDLVSAGSNIATGVSEAVTGAVTGATEAVTGAVEGVSGALEGIGAGLDLSGALAPIGAILGVIGGIVGIVEGESSPQEQAPILNPSSQFL